MWSFPLVSRYSMDPGRAFLMTLGAGLCTSIGGAIAFKVKPSDEKKFSVLLAISGGVMLYLCFTDMRDKAVELLQAAEGSNGNTWLSGDRVTTYLMFSTFAVCCAVDWGVARWVANKHKAGTSGAELDLEEASQKTWAQKEKSRKWYAAIFTASAVFVHNFPEGLSTYLANLKAENSFGVAMAAVIALHNVPQGVAVALPVFQATQNKWRAFWAATLAGLAQPAAAAIALLATGDVEISKRSEGSIYAVISGVMIYIALFKLYPESMTYDPELAGRFFLLGMGIMALSLVLIDE